MSGEGTKYMDDAVIQIGFWTAVLVSYIVAVVFTGNKISESERRKGPQITGYRDVGYRKKGDFYERVGEPIWETQQDFEHRMHFTGQGETFMAFLICLVVLLFVGGVVWGVVQLYKGMQVQTDPDMASWGIAANLLLLLVMVFSTALLVFLGWLFVRFMKWFVNN